MEASASIERVSEGFWILRDRDGTTRDSVSENQTIHLCEECTQKMSLYTSPIDLNLLEQELGTVALDDLKNILEPNATVKHVNGLRTSFDDNQHIPVYLQNYPVVD